MTDSFISVSNNIAAEDTAEDSTTRLMRISSTSFILSKLGGLQYKKSMETFTLKGIFTFITVCDIEKFVVESFYAQLIE
jgi:hypothetical protein